MTHSEMLANETDVLMNAEQVALYDRLQNFSLDRDEVNLSFSQRLAQDNGWSLDYAQQAIAEYKKFMFLAVAAGHPVTPSDQVDQVWHLHLSYSRSYWEEFCPQILQQPIHHEPTLGGDTENEKFMDWYGKTLESYEGFFGDKPPSYFWPNTEIRFARDLAFTRVNTQKNFVFPKSLVWQGVAIAVMAFSLIIVGFMYLQITQQSPDIRAINVFIILGLGLSYGVVNFASGVIFSIKNPDAPRYSGCSMGAGACGGCGWS
ncbi:MAG: hypothetical protein HC799_17030 [Limnothrix sp. RL_2_0]|nr:hypothetical protein [Limnothrix sp. RL_2_0]